MITARQSPLTLSELHALAPSRLPCRRDRRYQGDEERVRLDVFALEDQGLLRQIYKALLDLLDALKKVQGSYSGCRGVLKAFISTSDYQKLSGQVAHLGHATAVHKSSAEADRLVHDIRGGAFQALSFRLQLFALNPNETTGLQSIYFLVRDHLKIMRNCVQDLDLERFRRDALSFDHDAELLVEKWSNADFHSPGKEVRVELDCRYDGTLCESCLEFSCLDRVIYNLMSNAARHTADGLVYFYLLPVPKPDEANVRFVVVNAITEEHRQVLKNEFGNNLSRIFKGGFSTGGNGLGARICADFCSHAYGILDFATAQESGYFGARLLGANFVSWFHWPKVGR